MSRVGLVGTLDSRRPHARAPAAAAAERCLAWRAITARDATRVAKFRALDVVDPITAPIPGDS